MTELHSKAPLTYPAAGKLQTALFWTCMSVITLVPLVFTTSAYRIFVLPKFSILIVGSALVLLLFGAAVAESSDRLRALKSRHVALASLYVGASAISTLFGVSPLASLFGSFQAEMGLISRLCFLVCFVGLIAAVSHDERRLAIAAWVIAVTGLLTAVYAFFQFFGWDPFLPLSAYAERSPGGPVVRAIGTLGHSNYLGNFLLYTAPLTASLALAWRGRARRLAVVAVTFSAAAVAFSGTRGAWLGLLVGAATIVLLEVRRPKVNGAKKNRRRILGAAIACAGVIILALLISSSPASRDVATRAGSFVEDRFTGSGRILLWGDAIKMVPHFALLGCGPEAFSREFLAFKSFELARSAPQINNENPHNAYLDAAISFGIPGAILYAALIASAFSLLLRARRRAADRRVSLISSGLLASFAAVIVHNLFIYDQVPTGLYFFAFNALALGAWNITREPRPAGADELAAGQASTVARWTGLAVASLGAVLLVAATWFAVSLVMGDLAMKRAMVSARAGDFESLVAYGERATSSLDPIGGYNLQVARALALYADKLPKNKSAGSVPGDAKGKMGNARARSLEMAIDHGQRSLAHTLTPDANYSLLAYLALGKGDTQSLRNYASKAISWDPNYFNAHWLMAEALLAEGDREGAVAEAQMALRLAPGSSEARSVLARARGEARVVNPMGWVERARSSLERGNVDKAENLLQRAIRKSDGPCPECHRQLALTYEGGRRYTDAITQWEIYAREAPDQAKAEEVSARIEALRKK
ncbi:MAG: O-antigen ligase family protein [Acidobacteriota bacterium]